MGLGESHVVFVAALFKLRALQLWDIVPASLLRWQVNKTSLTPRYVEAGMSMMGEVAGGGRCCIAIQRAGICPSLLPPQDMTDWVLVVPQDRKATAWPN